MPMARVGSASDVARGDVQSGEQRGGAVANVVVGAPFQVSGMHRQQRLVAIERLDLWLLIDAEHHRLFGWMQIQTATSVT